MSAAIAARLDEIQQRAGVTSREVAQLLNTTPETVSRWRSGRAQPLSDRRNQLLQLFWLVGELADLYGPDEAHLWLYTPHKSLNRERPADRIQKNRIEDVLTVIDQLKDGAYV